MEIIDEDTPLFGLAQEAVEQLRNLSERFQAEGCHVTLIVTARDEEGLRAMAIASTIDDHEEMGDTLDDVADTYNEPYREDDGEEEPEAEPVGRRTIN